MVFHFKQFSLNHDRSTMKIGTDAVLLAALTNVGAAQSLLDIGCGCGVVAFCVAQQLAKISAYAQIFGVDLDAESIAEAKDNAQHYGLLPETNFHFQQTSVQEFAKNYPEQFDLIVSNPPFFNQDLKPENVSRLKSKHSDGQLSFQELIDSVCKLLKDDGRFVVILPKREGDEFDELASSYLHCTRRIFIQPTERKPIHRLILEYQKKNGVPCQEHRLIIRTSDNSYSEDYVRLMEPYLISVK